MHLSVPTSPRGRRPVVRLGLAMLAQLIVAATPALAVDPCVRPICREGFRFDGRRCERGPAEVTRARSHYTPDKPLCPQGWRVDGSVCRKVVCCEKSPCKEDERYRDGYCHRGPTFFGYRSHYRATCDEGWILDEGAGLCRRKNCSDEPGDQPPPPAVACLVTRLLPEPCVDRGGTITIRGEHFGLGQGSRRAVLGGHGISVELDVVSWRDTRIDAVLPDRESVAFGQWYYVGIQNAEGEWISNISETIDVCRQLE